MEPAFEHGRRARRSAAGLAVLAAVLATILSPPAAPAATLAVRRVVATPVPKPIPVLRPDVIAIPKLGVTAPVVPVGTTSDGSMGTPGNARDIAWWKGVRPGEGNALLAGHVSYNGRAGSFGRLKELQPGDRIVVGGENKALAFTVLWVKQVPGSADPSAMFAPQQRPVVTLITCGGAFDTSIGHHVDRVVVQATLAA